MTWPFDGRKSGSAGDNWSIVRADDDLFDVEATIWPTILRLYRAISIELALGKDHNCTANGQEVDEAEDYETKYELWRGRRVE